MKFNGNINRVAFLAVAITIGLSFLSCASAPTTNEQTIALELLSRKQVIDKFGIDQKLDPFIAPSGILKGTPYEFAVFRLSTSFASKTFVQLTIEVRDKDGKPSISLWDKKDFIEMWRSWNAGETKTINREALIEDYYVPSTDFPVPQGKSVYYIVLLGNNPLNKPIKVTIDVNAAGLSPYAQSFLIE